MSRIVLNDITTLFAPRGKGARSKRVADRALAMADAGETREAIFTATGATLALRNVSLAIAPGQITAIMGLSGSGKSTLIRHLNRLISPSRGQVLWDGADILSFSEKQLQDWRRHHVSMVFQGFGLLPHRNVLDNVAFGCRLRGDKPADCLSAARHWLDRVGLASHAQSYPDELSGGMRQRVGLARALAVDTEVLLMDEAFSALDPLIRHELQDQLLELQASLNKTIVLVTHDVDEALRLGQEIVLLRDGEIVQHGAPAELVQHPVDDYTRRFVQQRQVVVTG
ncbi:ATP-binding cassette domain-containing protein [Crenobacter sp. SG2303]|uniref:ATP-binding cassette domain-containing protein n=1 Tax=Crenobacter oryzisoli TaxID=3056844 RepID=A0ABT7XIR0_9NEIS|nr:ATP-binding cassette domain-containing protein [Crenobacter sp. SG2303]MDN0073684.1 ATP-binding cassette domain-containing protein [Crenobacter sp. SG2303]